MNDNIFIIAGHRWLSGKTIEVWGSSHISSEVGEWELSPRPPQREGGNGRWSRDVTGDVG